jgi:hypothetical protein
MEKNTSVLDITSAYVVNSERGQRMRSKLREALTQVIVELRPSWKPEDVRSALDHRDLASVNENMVTLAAIRCATDGNVRSPGAIPSVGPHWDEKPANTPTLLPPRFVPPVPLTDLEVAAAQRAAKTAKQTIRQLARASA